MLLLIISIVGINLIGGLSAVFAGDIASKYAQLTKPPLSPPPPTFGIVWPILYCLIGISLYFLITSRSTSIKKTALILFTVQLFVNFIWSIIFFAGNAFWFGFIVIIVLDILVGYLIIYAYQINKYAACLLVPYFIWILFATYLTLGTAILN
ncbi:TspO/MBR family protein [Paucilactobacillus hokkaidonensis]|uniref:TspO/MBR family protein n=1 Tax=Paucilactobacillus hokkaidonensis TaxID=1193095 RepID=UPI000A7FDA52|nr:TspO/MBR family protein [Paucilactobacillus hokkaidonensis]